MIELPEMPASIARLKRDGRGYPVPFFVWWCDGKPDFRIINPVAIERCIKDRLCWICGEKLGRFLTFVSGPMCGVNRISSEPASHLKCTHFAVKACPFMLLPKAKRRLAGLPENIQQPGPSDSIHLDRNPGVTMLWIVLQTSHIRVDWGKTGGALLHLPKPFTVEWWSQGRKATRDEVLESIDSGITELLKLCDSDEEMNLVFEKRKSLLKRIPRATR